MTALWVARASVDGMWVIRGDTDQILGGLGLRSEGCVSDFNLLTVVHVLLGRLRMTGVLMLVIEIGT